MVGSRGRDRWLKPYDVIVEGGSVVMKVMVEGMMLGVEI